MLTELICTCFSVIIVFTVFISSHKRKGTELKLTVGVVYCAMPCHAMRELCYVMLCVLCYVNLIIYRWIV